MPNDLVTVEPAGRHVRHGDHAQPAATGEPVQVELTIEEMNQEFGPASALTCPDCGGALWEIVDGQLFIIS